MKVIITGATGMVGEGVLLECLENPAVERVLSVSRRPSGHTHPKLAECLVPDFRGVKQRVLFLQRERFRWGQLEYVDAVQ